MPVRWMLLAFLVPLGGMLCARGMTFDEAAVKALASKEGLAGFTNDIERCAGQSTNVEAIALSKVLTAASIGRTNDVDEAKAALSDCLRQKAEDFLRD